MNREEFYNELTKSGFPVYWRMQDVNADDDTFIVYERVNNPNKLRRDNQNHLKSIMLNVHLFSKTPTTSIDDLMDDFNSGFVGAAYNPDLMLYQDTYEVLVYAGKKSGW